MASVKHIKDNKYRVFLCVKRQRATRVITAKSQKDAEKQAVAMEIKLGETGSLDGETKSEKSSLLVADLAERYMDYLVNKNKPIKEKTRQKYQDLLNNNILPYFKGYKVSAIDVNDAEKFLRFLGTPDARVNKSKKRPYSQGTIKEIFTLFDCMMKKAVIWDIIDSNPCDKVEKPVEEKKEVIYYNLEQMAELLRLIDKDTQAELDRAAIMAERGNYHPYTIQKIKVSALMKQLIVNLAVKTAARRGEILGLHRQDINFDKKSITYRRSVLYTKEAGTYEEKGLKTREMNEVYINDSLVELIKNYFKELDKLFEVSEGQLKPNNLLFMTLRNTKMSKVGDILFPDPISEWFKLFLADHGMPPITFHKLRSSSLTYLANNGTDLFTVSKVAGHSNTQTAEKYYVDGYDSNKAMAASTFDKLDELVKK
ncbi:Site-specific recombinase XerD [Caloramator quimbayensis]|uniref:Site-specific recombinase XerD n=1 Tax=Caloramator quimbayensis TaxID=1147123 RepID=A0A1T4YAE1_9CLOT|nr:site-specific integrase [Caloramator quimbayensis]SKA98650.1 Site-specific recombinase XerD [Caloramator quimbayensis]